MFWPELSKLGGNFPEPWLIIGDLNSIDNPDDKVGGLPFSLSSNDPFLSFIHSNGLIDLGFNGNSFTWSNKRSDDRNVKERLDRSLANREWLSLFPNATITHLPMIASDHALIILNLGGRGGGVITEIFLNLLGLKHSGPEI